MAIYLKKFENHTQYENYINGSSAILPNVSICTTEGDVYYNPYVEPAETKLVVYYDIQDISTTTTIFTNYDNSVKSIEIDGALLDNVVTAYQFNSIGEHIIKYEFNNETTVGNSAPLFYDLTTIKRIVIPDTFTSIANNAFNGNKGLTACTIGNGVTSIGDSSFKDCTSLTTIIIGNSVTSIGYNTFNGCYNLTNIIMPNSVTNIGISSFNGCGNFTSIIIPDNVTDIGSHAFMYCTNLTNVTVNATIPPTLGTQAFDYNADGRKIYVPSASVNAYKAASGWSTYATDILPIQ